MTEANSTTEATKHTSGPWAVHIDGLAVFGRLHGSDLQQVVDCDMCSPNLTTNERMANARLIATSPELLRFVQAFAEASTSDEGPGFWGAEKMDDIVRHARTLVVKATGCAR